MNARRMRRAGTPDDLLEETPQQIDVGFDPEAAREMASRLELQPSAEVPAALCQKFA